MLQRIVLICLAVLLVGCGPLRKPTSYKLVPPSSAKGQRCLKNCRTIQRMCYKMCHSDEGSCYDNAKARAQRKFTEYQNYQQQHQLDVSKTWKDFYNPRYCKDQACGCKKDYDACFQMCGGQLIPVYS